ncbi:hypothetical protein WMO64_01855 [Pseudoflavonifractor sp. CLA-AP-H29]|uniref:Uncharacterized protein n=1 Tax=Pseudoflavonifractor intestinihominis TaxID=3133171 RepID=A0ABV1E4H0_9FIRM
MADLEEKLNAILGNQEAMGQIMSIARSLSDAGDTAGSEAQSGDREDRETEHDSPVGSGEKSGGQPDSDAVAALLAGLTGQASDSGDNPLSLLGSLDPKVIQIALQLFSAYSAEDDRRTALLSALKPFLKEERQAKMEKAIQIAKLSRVIRVAFQVFKKEGGEADV